DGVGGGRRGPGRLAQVVDDGGEGPAVDELHGVVVDAAFAADGEDGDDVGVVQLGGGAGLVLEALQLAGVEGGGEGQHLEGDAPAQRQLHGLVDHAHATAADLAHQRVIAQGLLRRQGGGGGGRAALRLEARRRRVQELQAVEALGQLDLDVG